MSEMLGLPYMISSSVIPALWSSSMITLLLASIWLRTKHHPVGRHLTLAETTDLDGIVERLERADSEYKHQSQHKSGKDYTDANKIVLFALIVCIFHSIVVLLSS